MLDFRIVPPINLSSGTARGREMLGNLAEAAADLSCNPMGRVSGALFPFRADDTHFPGVNQLITTNPVIRHTPARPQIRRSYSSSLLS